MLPFAAAGASWRVGEQSAEAAEAAWEGGELQQGARVGDGDDEAGSGECCPNADRWQLGRTAEAQAGIGARTAWVSSQIYFLSI